MCVEANAALCLVAATFHAANLAPCLSSSAQLFSLLKTMRCRVLPLADHLQWVPAALDTADRYSQATLPFVIVTGMPKRVANTIGPTASDSCGIVWARAYGVADHSRTQYECRGSAEQKFFAWFWQSMLACELAVMLYPARLGVVQAAET